MKTPIFEDAIKGFTPEIAKRTVLFSASRVSRCPPLAANMSGISWTTTSAAPAKSSKVSIGGRQAVSRGAFAEFITRAFEEDIWPSDWTCLRRKNTPARRLGCGLRRGICQRSLLCESERFQSTFRNGRRRAHRPPLHGDRLSGRRRHVYRKQRAGQLYADSADRGLHHRSGRLRGVFPQPFREVMRPRT